MTEGYTRFCVYDDQGNIIRTGTVAPDSVDLQAVHAGEKVMECGREVRSGSHKVDLSAKGVPAVVALTQKELTDKSAAFAALLMQNAQDQLSAQLVLPLVGP